MKQTRLVKSNLKVVSKISNLDYIADYNFHQVICNQL